MPGTSRAHLDVEADHPVAPSAETLKLGRGARAATARREARTEHVGDLHRLPGLADRAVLARGLPHVAGRPQQLRVGVAHVRLEHPAPLDVPYYGVAGEPVLDARLPPVAASARPGAPGPEVKVTALRLAPRTSGVGAPRHPSQRYGRPGRAFGRSLPPVGDGGRPTPMALTYLTHPADALCTIVGRDHHELTLWTSLSAWATVENYIRVVL